ncbi:MAG: M4 family metallopeptidase [Bacteroidetes bacterium]|nr:M4 family metallopeptidase [Bacteroidota bacterium]
MRKFTSLLMLAVIFVTAISAREINGKEAQQQIKGAEKIITGNRSDLPEAVHFRKDAQPEFGNFSTWAHNALKLSADNDFILLNADKDKLGYTHYRFRETYKGIPVEASMYIVHVFNGRIVSMNGQIFGNISLNVSAGMTAESALGKALNYMNASTYRWQVPMWEKEIKRQTNNSSATWFPKGELMLAPENGNVKAENYKLTFRFDVYAEKPLKREYVYVDANNGEIVFTQNRIHTSNVTATAITAYSGLREIVTDSVNPTTYRLREANRGTGLGIETFNLQQGTTYNNTDFLDTDNYWDNVNVAQDEYATDAHWGSEMTYDFYWQNFQRNSIDGAGMLLTSYVHYDQGYTNAFWDGTEMTYGDGSNPYTPLTSLEIAGHEISHGVTERTSGLIYSDESGAMNEGFSDCMGNSIRYYGKGGIIDWGIGDEIGGTPFRDMSDPNLYQNPDCYNGTYWNAPNEVHNNSGVLNFWYYLLTTGGSGTNDLGNAYSVTGITIAKAQQICYRMNAVYLFPSATYADARQWAIQAAIDLYGPCSPEHESTANAWHAVGVGSTFTPGVTAGFAASGVSFCTVPATVTFMNSTSNANIFNWNFGDGGSSTDMNPTHVYTTGGQFTVTLYADGGICGSDTNTIVNYIDINLPQAPTATGATICPGNTASLNATGAGTLAWYLSAIGGNPVNTGTSFNTPVLNTTTTYYVESQFPSPAQFNTPHTNNGGGTYYANVTYRGEIFDVYAPCTLVSVLVYSQAAVSKTILLKNNGVTINSTTVNIPNGSSRVTLNFPLPVGTSLELGTDDGVDLFRNNAGAVYPFTLGGLVSITDNTANANGYYYFFYDWEVLASPCASVRVPVVATVDAVTAGFTSSIFASIVTFTDNSNGGNIVSYAWDFGDGSTSTLANPVYTYANVGPYVVCLTVTNSSGCTNTTCNTINILQVGINEANSISEISVYPNPVSDLLSIKFKSLSDKKWTMKLNDLTGRVIAEKTAENIQSLVWDVADIAPGTYVLNMQSGDEQMITRITKQ